MRKTPGKHNWRTPIKYLASIPQNCKGNQIRNVRNCHSTETLKETGQQNVMWYLEWDTRTEEKGTGQKLMKSE